MGSSDQVRCEAWVDRNNVTMVGKNVRWLVDRKYCVLWSTVKLQCVTTTQASANFSGRHQRGRHSTASTLLNVAMCGLYTAETTLLLLKRRNKIAADCMQVSQSELV